MQTALHDSEEGVGRVGHIRCTRPLVQVQGVFFKVSSYVTLGRSAVITYALSLNFNLRLSFQSLVNLGRNS